MSGIARVTKIKPLARDPNMRQILVNGRLAVTLRATDIEQLRVREGDAWTANLARNATHLRATLQARRQAMQMLGKRPLSKRELIERLVRRGHSEAIAAEVASELAADHWIDDVEYARDVAQSLMRRKPASKALVRSKLVARKLDDSLADEIASETVAAGDELAAVELAEQTLGRMKGVSKSRAARRIAGTLARRGFDDAAIVHALEQIGLAGNEDEGDEAES